MAENERRAAFLALNARFRTNAFRLIEMMVELCSRTAGSSHLVDEILYTIFFLGQILDLRGQLKFHPREIIDNDEMYEALKERYKVPIQHFESQTRPKCPLPRRSPFSCVLDMFVLREGPENETEIRSSLRRLVNTLEPDFLVSTVICVSRSIQSDNQYGVSMSTTGLNARKVVLAASCLSGYWNEYVADAVMTYYPVKEQRKSDKSKKNYFDGTFRVPAGVSCQAYKISDERSDEMDPCLSCRNLFGLTGQSPKENIYGNCAEAESLSNLLNVDANLTRFIPPRHNTCTPENRDLARAAVEEMLRQTLNMVQFRRWNGEYYNPQRQ
ncbi:uncharacterized protein LOC108238735 isoform X2 [Kryptolebias marmoratus]|uniref:uncharacterized protein LOC108238735 isoform X2 n=1 Tax=Kryptolebias marmoratus TaxID=37003 RepID=UPI0007F87892|nr:uncharacterized protein LOC108238735 isoform X2 [Kryptolebias marmoratus]